MIKHISPLRLPPCFRVTDRLLLVGVLCLAVVSLQLTSCSKKEMEDMVAKAKQTVDDTTQSVKQAAGETMDAASEQVGLAGNVSLTLDSPVSINACYATFIEQSPTRPNVLKMQTYRTAAEETSPSALIQAQVGEMTQTQLSGKTISAQVYVQTAADGAVWHTKTSEPVQLVITAIQADKLTANFVSGKLYNTHSGSSVDVKGSLEGLFSQP